jgi:hypothetical protein
VCAGDLVAPKLMISMLLKHQHTLKMRTELDAEMSDNLHILTRLCDPRKYHGLRYNVNVNVNYVNVNVNYVNVNVNCVNVNYVNVNVNYVNLNVNVNYVNFNVNVNYVNVNVNYVNVNPTLDNP